MISDHKLRTEKNSHEREIKLLLDLDGEWKIQMRGLFYKTFEGRVKVASGSKPNQPRQD